MATNFKTPSQIGDDFLTNLKALKPQVNTSQKDTDWWIRSRVIGGVVGGAYADQRAISNDPFPQNARHDGLGNSLQTFLNRTFIQPQPSVGFAAVTGTAAGPYSVGLQFSYVPNGNAYQSVSGGFFDSSLPGGLGVALIPIQSVGKGAAQNLLSGAPLLISTPPAGITAAATASGNLSDGRDIETDAEAAAAILSFIQSPPAGGTAADYKTWAGQADPSVVAASVTRYAFGLGTLAVVITAGTTDIDTALNNNQPIVLTPSAQLISTVQAYLDSKRPVTDCVQVVGPVQTPVNVTVNVKYVSGIVGSTILANQTLTCDQLVAREVQRAIYKTPPGGRLINGSGFVLTSEIEQVLDNGLGSEQNTSGTYAQILLDREVLNLDGTLINFPLATNQQPIPGTITVVSTGWN